MGTCVYPTKTQEVQPRVNRPPNRPDNRAQNAMRRGQGQNQPPPVNSKQKQNKAAGARFSRLRGSFLRQGILWQSCFLCSQKFVQAFFSQHLHICQLRQKIQQQKQTFQVICTTTQISQQQLNSFKQITQQKIQELEKQRQRAIEEYDRKSKIFIEENQRTMKMREAEFQKMKSHFKPRYQDIQAHYPQKSIGECQICLQIMSPSTLVVRLPCLHPFHKACLDKWFEKKDKKCPFDQFELS